MTSSAVMTAARALARQGRGREAVALIADAARRGDPECAFEVATWRLWGQYGPRDIVAVHALLREAGAAGHAASTALRAALIANGTGAPADWQAGLALLRTIPDAPGVAAQLALIDAMSLNADGSPGSLPTVASLSERPAVGEAAGLLTSAECLYLMTAAGPRLRPSQVVDARGARVPNPTRTSDGAIFGPVETDLVVRAIDLRLAALSGTAIDCGEPLQILRYRPGEQYRPHLDALPGEHNQRVATVLVYLNDRYQGGETLFTQTGLQVRPSVGKAAVFRNVDDTGRPDQSARHAGLPVASGIKWLATRWIRQRPSDPWASLQG